MENDKTATDQGWIFQVQRTVETEIDEFEHGGVQQQKVGHDAIVNVFFAFQMKFVWRNPSHGVAHDVCLVVDALHEQKENGRKKMQDVGMRIIAEYKSTCKMGA